jgi:acyl-CoA thioesterase I
MMVYHATYKIRTVILLILTLALVSCSSESLPKLSDDGVILAFGDSLTAGVGVKPEQSYPTQLANLTGLKVINAGVSGETTAEGVARFKELIDSHYPDLVILLEGGNDILRNHSEIETKRNLASMIEYAQQKQIPLVLVGVPKKSLFSSSADFYAQLSDEYQLILDDWSISEIIKTPSLKSDSVHFNQAGYKKLADNIFQLLQTYGAVD